MEKRYHFCSVSEDEKSHRAYLEMNKTQDEREASLGLSRSSDGSSLLGHCLVHTLVLRPRVKGCWCMTTVRLISTRMVFISPHRVHPFSHPSTHHLSPHLFTYPSTYSFTHPSTIHLYVCQSTTHVNISSVHPPSIHSQIYL